MAIDNELVKLLLKQMKLLNSLANIVGDQSLIIDGLLTKCQNPECVESATMKHVNGAVMCDRHAAEHIVASTDEASWAELPNAESVRRNNEYVNIMRQLSDTEGKVQ